MERTPPWLIYGANGYTGRLLAREAIARNMRPTLAGRSRAEIERLGRLLGCETCVVSLDDPALARNLTRFGCVLMAAGPFSRTSQLMLDACLTARCHYLDVAGELDVIADCYARHEAALAARIAVIPAVGFSVVPMDCLAANLAAQSKGANRLELAFEGYELSAGTAKTYVEGMARGTARRIEGRLERSPFIWELHPIPFRRGVRRAVPVPYGELVSCHRATGIANISVLMAPPRSLELLLHYGPVFLPLLHFAWAKRAIDRLAELRFAGPDESARRTRRTQIWGRVIGSDGSERQGFVETPEPYQLTLATALSAVKRVLRGSVPPGALTPSQAFGADFLSDVGGCTIEIGARHP